MNTDTQSHTHDVVGMVNGHLVIIPCSSHVEALAVMTVETKRHRTLFLVTGR